MGKGTFFNKLGLLLLTTTTLLRCGCSSVGNNDSASDTGITTDMGGDPAAFDAVCPNELPAPRCICVDPDPSVCLAYNIPSELVVSEDGDSIEYQILTFSPSVSGRTWISRYIFNATDHSITLLQLDRGPDISVEEYDSSAETGRCEDFKCITWEEGRHLAYVRPSIGSQQCCELYTDCCGVDFLSNHWIVGKYVNNETGEERSLYMWNQQCLELPEVRPAEPTEIACYANSSMACSCEQDIDCSDLTSVPGESDCSFENNEGIQYCGCTGG